MIIVSEPHSADQAAQPPFRPSLHVSGVPGRGGPGGTSPVIGEVGQDNPLVSMLTQTSQLIGQRGYKNRHETGCWLPPVGVEYLPLTSIHRVSTPSSHGVHRRCTVSPTCTHEVDAALSGPPLRCRPVRTTPLYDQLRGERINADVPPSAAQPHQLEDRGKHRLADGDLGSVTGCTRPPRTAADRANADVAPRDADPQQRDHPAKHHLPDGEPDLAAAFTRPPAATADQVATWSWFATAESTGRPR